MLGGSRRRWPPSSSGAWPPRSPAGQESDLPEVTFDADRIASTAAGLQHARMPERMRQLLQPLNLAAMLTLVTVAVSLRNEAGTSMPLAYALIGAYLAAFLACDVVPPQRRWMQAALYAFAAACAFALVWVAPRTGTAPVLFVVLIAALALDYPPRRVLALVVLLDLALYVVLRARGHVAPAVAVTVYLGFQAFAALIAHYARTAEHARDQLALVNAHLLATRALLADSARDAERLRVARELHDVAGHKLTAMSLNLHVLASDPAISARSEIVVARQMAGELLADIRNVVHALRDARGLDLATALHALAAPLPRPRLELDIGHDVRVDDPALAETVLRLVQEALTNSARHSGAARVRVAIRHGAGGLALTIDDDGRMPGPLREGNGLSGMRERVAERGGRLAFERAAHGSLRIQAELPL
jgi:signal transduction histidine kinase